MNIPQYLLNLQLPFLHNWAYLLIFAATTFETMPFGFAIPGQTILIFAGFLARVKILRLAEVMLSAGLGAFSGDILSYYIGRKYGFKFITKYGKYFFFKKEIFAKTRNLMNEHSGKTLIIGKFNSFTRSFSAFIAGSSAVAFKKFFIYSLIGGFTWSVAWVLAGYIFGSGYVLISKYTGRLSVAAIVLALVILYVYKFINKRWHIFAKYDVVLLLVNIFSLYIFFKMAEDVLDGEKIVKYDLLLSQKIPLLWTPVGSKIMYLVTLVMNIDSAIFLSVLLFLILLLVKRWNDILIFFSTWGGGLLLNFATKIIFHRPRPLARLIPVSGFSFPSSHATTAVIFFFMLIYFFKNDIKNKFLKTAFVTANIFLIILVSFSRLYLNVHWLSDVIAGLALGLFWTTLIILIFKYTTSLVEKLNEKKPIINETI